MFKQLTGAVRRLFSPSTGQTVTVRQEELQQPQARASAISVRSPSPGISVASTLSPGRLAGILRGAADGNARDFFIMAEELEERDLHYSSVLRTRKLTVAGIEPSVEAASDDARDVDIADAVRNLITQPQIPELLFDLLDGLGKGVSVCEILWDTSSQFWQPRDYEWVDPRFLKPDRDTLRNFHLLTDASPIDGEPLSPGKYVVHQPRLKSGLPLRNGLARLVAVMYMLKSYTVRDWWAFAEKFGIPVVVGKYGNNASPEQIQTMLDAIASLASDAGCAIPDSMKLEMQETASRNNGGALFKEMAVWCDEQISKAVLGQTMTTDNGSSRSQADVHDRVRMDIARWDARQLENTLNEFLVRPFVIMNYGPQDAYPRVVLRLSEPEDLKMLVDALIPLIDRGMEVQMSEVRDKFGLSEPEKGAAMLVPSSQALQPALAMNRERVALNRSQWDDIDLMVDDAMRDWQRTGDAFTSPVLQLAREADSFEAFLAGLPELQKTLEPDEFVTQLAQLCFKARTLGDVSDA
jgi:phage gp29-like protein